MENIWEEFLNPTTMKKRFLAAGLFMVAHEMLVATIVERLHEFFSNEWESGTGWKTGPTYRSKVLSLDPKGKEDAFRSSIQWLREIDAISDLDEVTIMEITVARNQFAHELRHVVGTGNGPDFECLFPKIVALAEKIDRWWILNVEIDTDPDYAGIGIEADDIVTGSTVMLQLMQLVALGDEKEAWEFYEEFLKGRS